MGIPEAQLKAKLLIDPPNELRFRGPFTKPVINTLQLTNPSDNDILFKIKTTAPKRYCVRPNFGCVKGHETTSVEICLQQFNFDPFEKNKHKFMVQSVVCPLIEDEPIGYFDIWKELPPENFMDAKLKCVFEMPNEDEDEQPSAAVKVVKNETSASPPQVKNEEKQIPSMDNMDRSEYSVTKELRELREENSKLRKENINVKEQVLRLRSIIPKQSDMEFYNPARAEKQIPMFFIAITIAAVIFGILFGKFLL